MFDNQSLRQRAVRCLQLAERLQTDAETLKRFGEELAEMAALERGSSSDGAAAQLAREQRS